MKTVNKKLYDNPEVKTQQVLLEQTLAAGSITVVPPNSSSVVSESWETDPNDDRSINW
ncbi:hypothetical protein [uncultured Sphingobacterium sp.]|uniref:hypothetical protein n=1 Tax=uncultured Sphingobacterium sp. TaxID=182688 RepID=UPI0025D967C2|nr:hypothetical protein [uncultured Sphingobacterium sp.]